MSGIVLFSDPHFCNRTAFGHIDPTAEFPGCNSRFHETAKAFRAAVEYAKNQGCESIFILGDIFHDRGSIDVPVYNAVYQLFKETVGTGIRLVIYPGNHDTVDLRAMHINKHLHSLFTYEKIAYVYDQPSIVQTAYFPIAVIPYSNSGREVIAATDKLADRMTGDIRIVMFHHSFNDAVTGPHEWVMPHKLDANDISQAFTHKFSGHYHLHQKLAGNLWYVGSPLHHDFGERNYTPGFIHMLPDGTWKHIENITSPRFQVITTMDQKDLENLSTTDYISIKWGGSMGEIEKIKETLPENCIIEYNNNNGVSSSHTRTSIKTTDAVEDMIEKYAEAKTGSGYPAPSEIVEHGKNLYKGK